MQEHVFNSSVLLYLYCWQSGNHVACCCIDAHRRAAWMLVCVCVCVTTIHGIHTHTYAEWNSQRERDAEKLRAPERETNEPKERQTVSQGDK